MKNIIFTILITLASLCNAQDKTAGIYYKKDVDKLCEIIPILHTKGKGTAGLYSGKFKRIYKDSVSKNIVNSTPTFYVYYGDIPTGKKRQYYIFNVSDNPADLTLVKLVQKEETRELTIGKIKKGISSTFTTQVGVNFNIEKINEKEYKITFNDKLEDGEYCFMLYDPDGQGVDGYIFDFSVGGRDFIKEHRDRAGKDSMYFY